VDCFASYAAHELRREITLQLALAGIALSDPDADATALREMGERVIAGCKRQEGLLEALLTLARSEYGQLPREPIDLAATAADVMRAHNPHPLRRVTSLEPAVTLGNPELVERLVTNLVENAVRHNIPHGRVDLATHTAAGRAVLTITNTGPVIPTGDVDGLFRPFQRLRSHPGAAADGIGLGLAIVQAIADGHDATIHANARTGGGLSIDISFPLFSPGSEASGGRQRGLAASSPIPRLRSQTRSPH
jgi:signal transduction histidine kinase